eukprot:TRINITY_DN17384_c0_g1_i1.p1 TRINITY_DN17384_c0_g1~~TRINITY_DN17384_c0_g1_i1.p1  ORF type:complete len:520 (+),score=68.39 TRINITY_DN17384_c0_g1_i1:71-1561(+)
MPRTTVFAARAMGALVLAMLVGVALLHRHLVLQGMLMEVRTVSYTLGICSSVKDDERGLVEWIEFHRAVGVEHFFLIDDGSSDATAGILEYYSLVGVVTVLPGQVPRRDARCAKPDRRDSAYVGMCFDHAAPRLTWMAIIDSDEYMYPRQGCDLAGYIQASCSASASHILLRWEMFGGGRFSLQPHGLLAENFLTSGGDCSAYTEQWGESCGTWRGYCKECRHTKYIANTARCLRRPEHCENHVPGRLRLAPETCDIDPDPWGACLRWWEAEAAREEGRSLRYSPDCCAAGVGFNHYAVRSEESQRWRAKRRMRNGLREDRDATPPLDTRDLNWALSTDILRFLPALRAGVTGVLPPLVQHLARSPRPAFRSYAQRFRAPYAPVSQDVRFISAEGVHPACFVERGFAYAARPGYTRLRSVTEPVADEAACCAACRAAAATCLAFTYRPSHGRCLLLEPHTGARGAVWPPAALPAERARRDGFIAGAILEGDVCGVE